MNGRMDPQWAVLLCAAVEACGGEVRVPLSLIADPPKLVTYTDPETAEKVLKTIRIPKNPEEA